MAANQDLKSANVTKYEAGGSGDNYISDGYIKSVEKVWIESYNNTTILGSIDTIAIGKVPKNAKVTDITVYLPALQAAAVSLATIFACTGSSMLATHGSCFFGGLINLRALEGVNTISVGTAQTVTLRPDKRNQVTNKDCTVYLRLVLANLKPLNITVGTIRSIIKYT